MNTLNIHIVASSSAGNCVIVGDGVSSIMLDCGLSYRKILRAMPIDVQMVLLSHEHLDHAKSAGELIRRGYDVGMSKGTADALGLKGYTRLKSLEQRETGGWLIVPFEVEHDAAEPLGFLIESKSTGGKAVFIVDSAIVDYDFTGITHWLIECNYSEEILSQSEKKEWLKDRIRGSHFSLDNLKTFLQTSDLSKTEAIYLLHLSDSNSDEKRFIAEVQAVTGVPVYAGQRDAKSFITRRKDQQSQIAASGG